ncbi:MAG: DUF192 domain-containing protein [Phycisphaerae bacterium]|nr:DUF192 domain-containing protein [Phycisphaerae bacterium]
MKKATPKITVILAVFVLVVVGAFLTARLVGCEKKTPEPRTAEVKIGDKTWVVELAMTERARHKGLSGRRELPDRSGMLFIYPEPTPLKFCMRRCLIPIDIVFIDADLRVVNTYAMKNHDPDGLTPYSSGVAVPYALELPGGTVKKCGIKNDDLVEFVDVPDRREAESAK